MCMRSNGFSEQLYERYIGTLRAFVRLGACSGSLVTDLGASWKNYSVFADAMVTVFAYLDQRYVPQNNLHCLETVVSEVFRAAIDDAYGSQEAANAAVSACTTFRDKDKKRLIASQSSTTTLSVKVIECTRLDIRVEVKGGELKLADLCLKQVRIALASELKSITEQKASLCEQLRIVNGALAGSLTLNEIREEWQTWDSKYVSTLWSAFNRTETSWSSVDGGDCRALAVTDDTTAADSPAIAT
jgi:predicted metal-binding protein